MMKTKPTSSNKTLIIILSSAAAALVLLTFLLLYLLVWKNGNDSGNFSAEEQKWLNGYEPRSMSDTPPGFGRWTMNAQCRWQLKFFPDVLDGYCGESIDDGSGSCDEFCQIITD